MTDQMTPDACEPAISVDLMPEDEATQLSVMLKTLADPIRVRVLAYLASTPAGTVCSCHLPGRLGISQPTLSHHLKKLTDAGLVTREQRGRWAHYTAQPDVLTSLGAQITQIGT
ncbi:ArsR/SmtB family transcription factor [Curtobacterium sp. S6]|uniref:ArsR/SmtB family transcription factor n=1 Tax=Curtobacterium sp. S6 TaxID=1479623 RepID=UPI0004AA8241|nr:metalloregulator ArsR/SmtB family transcription factor [Curtobacterium sp. S6]